MARIFQSFLNGLWLGFVLYTAIQSDCPVLQSTSWILKQIVLDEYSDFSNFIQWISAKKIGYSKVLVVLIVELTQTHYHREKLLHHENCLPLCHRIVGCGMFIWHFWVVGVPLNVPKIASVWNSFFQSRLLAIPLCIWKLK